MSLQASNDKDAAANENPPDEETTVSQATHIAEAFELAGGQARTTPPGGSPHTDVRQEEVLKPDVAGTTNNAAASSRRRKVTNNVLE